MKDEIVNYYYKSFFDLLAEKYKILTSKYNDWEYHRAADCDIRLFLRGKTIGGLTICCDVSKGSRHNFCYSIWSGGDFDWRKIKSNRELFNKLIDLGVVKYDDDQDDYLIYEDIPKSIFKKTMKGDVFANLCFTESEKIANYISEKIETFLQNEEKVNDFKSLYE
jgi:hypothetical protein